jgi:hypothetical protein
MNRWDSEPLWMILDPPATVTRPAPEPVAPEPDVSPWQVQKSMNRLSRKLQQVASGVLVPRAMYRLTGEAAQEVHAARTLLQETADVLKEASRDERVGVRNQG